MALKMSALEGQIKDTNVSNEMKKMRKELKKMMDCLQNLNSTNRLLTNRARVNVKEMMTYITGGKSVCNVEV